MHPNDKVATFRNLHERPGDPLVLPNAWDAGSARLVESLGAKAVATTSAGMAWSLGYADGDHLPVEHLVRRASEIIHAVSVPVSIDVESGYSNDPATVAEYLAPVFETGIAGINIEDGAEAPELLARKVEAIKRSLSSRGIDVFVNVRTDVYLRNLRPDDQKIAEILAREKTYRSAGADGLFVPGITDAGHIAAVAGKSELPVNVMAMPGLPKLKELARMNVRRLSAGSALAQVVWKSVGRLAKQFLAEGDSDSFGEGMGYGELQALFVDTH
jgi:2-methylisocitrate lyase-like PEP mutase family enzyme